MADTVSGGIHQAMFNVKRDVGTLQKDGEGPATQGKYKYLKIDDIMEKIKPLFVREQIQVYPQLVEHETRMDLAGPAAAPNGTPIADGRVPSVRVREFVIYEYVFVYLPDGSAVSVKVSGEAMDTQDKASRKAATSTWKTALIQTFDIITGEPDPDGETAESAAPEVPKQNRQAQQTTKAHEAATRSVTTDPKPKPKDDVEDLPAPAEPELDETTKLKRRIAASITALGGQGVYDKVTVDAIAAKAIGKPDAERSTWINSTPSLKKVVKAMEDLVASKAEADAAAAATGD